MQKNTNKYLLLFKCLALKKIRETMFVTFICLVKNIFELVIFLKLRKDAYICDYISNKRFVLIEICML